MLMPDAALSNDVSDYIQLPERHVDKGSADGVINPPDACKRCRDSGVEVESGAERVTHLFHTSDNQLAISWEGRTEFIDPACDLSIIDLDEKEYAAEIRAANAAQTSHGKSKSKRSKANKGNKQGNSFTLNIPKPMFKKTDGRSGRKYFVNSTEFISFLEKSSEELNQLVEYEMEEEDFMWLDIINQERNLKGFLPISEDDFEFLIDRFEKESYFQTSRLGQPFPTVDEDALCCICLDGECHNSNAILFCDMCNLAVHQECYGVPYIPDGQWLCRRCLYSPSYPVSCALCTRRCGAFKQSDDDFWVHVVCALWIPELHFLNSVFMEPISGLNKVAVARRKLTCYICKVKGVGACIQCSKANCFTAFHITCAQEFGLYLKVEDDPVGGFNQSNAVGRFAFCDQHTPIESLTPDAIKACSGNIQRALKLARKSRIIRAKKIFAGQGGKAPPISLPVVPADRIAFLKEKLNFDDREEFFCRIYSYWKLKRWYRNGVPLIRRLQRDAKRSSVSHSNSEDIDLAMKLNKALDAIEIRDRHKIFLHPVLKEEAPFYYDIIKHPVDLTAMRNKVNNSLYKNIGDFTEDFNTMCRNCFIYNATNSPIYRYGKRVQKQGLEIINQIIDGTFKAPVKPVKTRLQPECGQTIRKKRRRRSQNQSVKSVGRKKNKNNSLTSKNTGYTRKFRLKSLSSVNIKRTISHQRST